ncbi:MAG: PilZ domain-containing protein [Myxococcota bacterium]|nr:PilZ domain-containing protein [Myxococcota bacterium]
MERRSTPRASLPGVRVTYESAAGERVEADTLNLAPGGLFVRTRHAPKVGKRLVLDLGMHGSQETWSALGRVVWVRESDESANRPRGMGVKLIDADDAAVEAFERLVTGLTASGEHTRPGLGDGLPPSVREQHPFSHSNTPSNAEPSVAFDLVSRGKLQEARRDAGSAPFATAPEHLGARHGRGAGRWIFTLLALIAAAAIAYKYAYGSFNAR